MALRRVQTERVLQNSERSAHETLALAVAFDDIREELINNRVDTEELKAAQGRHFGPAEANRGDEVSRSWKPA